MLGRPAPGDLAGLAIGDGLTVDAEQAQVGLGQDPANGGEPLAVRIVKRGQDRHTSVTGAVAGLQRAPEALLHERSGSGRQGPHPRSSVRAVRSGRAAGRPVSLTIFTSCVGIATATVTLLGTKHLER